MPRHRAPPAFPPGPGAPDDDGPTTGVVAQLRTRSSPTRCPGCGQPHPTDRTAGPALGRYPAPGYGAGFATCSLDCWEGAALSAHALYTVIFAGHPPA